MAKRIPIEPEMALKAQLIGARIKLRREQKGYSQLTLSTLIGVTSGAIGQYETGRNLPTMQKLERLSLELDVTTEWLMTGHDPDEKVKAHTTAERTALQLLRAIPLDRHEAALAMLRGLTVPEQKPAK